jgi:hypothetical protein
MPVQQEEPTPQHGRSKCAVSTCAGPCSDRANLCKEHRVAGIAVESADSSMIVTVWYAEHEGESGLILLNDFALGDSFGGAAGFMERLKRQGFLIPGISRHSIK